MFMKTFRTHYDNLKVARDAPDIVIRAAYKSLSQRFHPDKNPGDERAAQVMSIINRSYEILSDPQKRAEHDVWIALEEKKHQKSTAQSDTAPIPPQRQTPPQPTQAKLPSHSILKKVLLWPFKLVLQIIVAVPQLAVLGLIFGGIALYDAVTPDRPPPPGPKPYSATPVAQPTRPSYSRPPTAPNGNPWPVSAGYIKGYQRLHANGLSTVTVDNSRNDSDVFVKLVSLDGAQAYPVRQFYIPAFASFTLNKVTAGSYDVRYRDLTNGGLSRSEASQLEETPTYDGTQYSNITMTLYKVQNGNMQTYGLSEAEF